MDIKKNAEGWLKDFPGLEILDGDGWDRKNFHESWAEEITLSEFKERVWRSTIRTSREASHSLFGI